MVIKRERERETVNCCPQPNRLNRYCNLLSVFRSLFSSPLLYSSSTPPLLYSIAFRKCRTLLYSCTSTYVFCLTFIIIKINYLYSCNCYLFNYNVTIFIKPNINYSISTIIVHYSSCLSISSSTTSSKNSGIILLLLLPQYYHTA